MPRPLRADEAGGIDHALNRGNARQEIFHKVEDYVAFEKVLVEGLKRHPVDLFAYQWMPNHWHMVLGTERWVESIARRLNLESTLRPRRRPKKLA